MTEEKRPDDSQQPVDMKKGNIEDLKKDIIDLSPQTSDIAEGREVVMGESLADLPASDNATKKLASMDDLENALRQVFDPEIPVNIFDLGLIYELQQVPNGDVNVVMTLTAPACPVAGEMPKQVAESLAVLEGVGKVRVKLTWTPAWTMEKMSADAKLALGFG